MKDSTRRAVRTAYQYVVGAVIAVPGLYTVLLNVHLTSTETIGTAAGGLLAFTTAASKAINVLEERGLIPAVLKTGTPLPVQTDNSPRPEDGDQSGISQDPNVSYEGDVQ